MTSSSLTRARIIVSTAIAVGALGVPCPLTAQPQVDPPRAQPASRVGVHGFGTAGLNWLAAKQSLEATGFDRQQIELGGGVQVSRLWRDLLVRASGSRLSTEGERVFVNSAGESTRLGIPLTLEATYVDVTGAWTAAPTRYGGRELVPYVGAGAGRVKYSERSPFAEPGDDLEVSKTTYHVLGGVHTGLLSWFGVSVDARYRWVPKLIGDGGATGAFNEKDFGGFDLTVGLNIGFWGRRSTPPPRSVPPADEAKPGTPGLFKSPERVQTSNSGLIAVSSPVFLRPDATLTPLRILEAGTSVRILEDAGEWIRVEFPDSQWGPRVGYVQRKNMRMPK